MLPSIDAGVLQTRMRAIKEVLRQAGDIAAGKPFLLRRKFTDPKYA